MVARASEPQFKRKIRSYLQRSGTSMRALSMQAGLAPDTVKGILSGKSSSSREDTLRALAAVMKMTYGALVEGEPPGATGASPEVPFAGYGGRIAEARRARGLNRQDLAAAIGLNAELVALWEIEKLLPDGYSLVRLRGALDISADWILLGRPPLAASVRESATRDAGENRAQDDVERELLRGWRLLPEPQRAVFAAMLLRLSAAA